MATLQANIDTIQDTLDDIHDAIIAKGGTTSGTDITSYASGINSIPIPMGINREVSAQGVYQTPTTSFTFSLPSNATNLGNYALYYAFYGCTGLTSVDLSSLTTVSGDFPLYYAFYGCTGLTSVDLSSLTTVSGSSALNNAFHGCKGLTSVNFSSLITLLSTGSFNPALGGTFRNCISLQTLSFPALTSTSFGSYTNQFNSMLSGVTGCTVHFPSNLQSIIGSWSSVTSGFGGTNTTVLFDLPATT